MPNLEWMPNSEVRNSTVFTNSYACKSGIVSSSVIPYPTVKMRRLPAVLIKLTVGSKEERANTILKVVFIRCLNEYYFGLVFYSRDLSLGPTVSLSKTAGNLRIFAAGYGITLLLTIPDLQA